MVTFQEAGEMLDGLCEALPQEIFKELNGGVNLLPDVKKSEDGRIILGFCHNDAMGRYVEIFYGSIGALYGDIPAEKFRERLRKTLHHELTHHIESLAGDHTLEHWDEAQQMMGMEPIETQSVLFVDDDDCALAPTAAAMFDALTAELDAPMRVGSAGMEQGSAMQPDAVKAAGNAGVDIAGHVPQRISAALINDYDAVFCMTMLQADELAERYPARDERIFCLGDTDILLPRLKIGWGGTMKRIKGETARLFEELCGEEEK